MKTKRVHKLLALLLALMMTFSLTSVSGNGIDNVGAGGIAGYCKGTIFQCSSSVYISNTGMNYSAVASGERNDMAYKFKYNERPRSYSEEKHGDEDIPSAKAVRDTAVEERDGKIIKSRRQHVCGREYIVFAEFSFGGTQSTVDLMKQVIDLEQDAKNISA